MELAQSTKIAGSRAKVAIAVAVVVIIAAAALFFFFSSAFTGAPTSTVTTPSIVIVILPDGVGINQSLNFEPVDIRVAIGVNNTIRWIDEDPVPHTITSTDVPSGASAFDSGTINEGDIFEVTFSTPGTYSYFCVFHPGWMKGMIIVKA